MNAASALPIGDERVRAGNAGERDGLFRGQSARFGPLLFAWNVSIHGDRRKYSRVRVADEAIIARCGKQSWFRFIDWIAIAFTIGNVQARSFTMRQSNLHVASKAARPTALGASCRAGTMAESCTAGVRVPQVA